MDLKEMENPDDTIMLSEAVMQVLNQALEELYQLKVEAEVLN
jgi:hypothetical protein